MKPPIRVLTLNVWNRGGPWDERLATIRQGIQELAPDVIGLQEVVRVSDGDQLDQAAEIAKSGHYQVAYGRTPSDRGYPFGNAVLSRWPILRADVFPLPRGGTDEYRNLLFAEIDSPFGRLPFFTTHLNWKLDEGHVREMQVREIALRVKELAPVGSFPPIVVGDFNAPPDADEIRFMRGLTSLGGESVYFADAFAVASAAGGQNESGASGATFCRRNPFATSMREPDRRIDYVFVRGPDDRGRGEPLESRICFDQPVGGVYASDHFGVMALIAT